MELRVLRYFVQVARDESITRAAKALHISQPTLSKQISQLEDELGVRLFTRTNYAVRLTEDGIRLRLRAEDIIAMADQTVNEFTHKDQTVSGKIRIGAAEAQAVRHLGNVMKSLYTDYPDISYHLYAGDTEMLQGKLDSGFLDFLLIAEDPDLTRCQSIPLPFHDQWGVIVRRDHPLAKQETVAMDDLAEYPLIVSRQAMHQDLARLFGPAAHRMKIIADYDLAHNASLLVQEGFGSLLVFDKLINCGEETDLTFRPLRPALYTKCYLVYRKYNILSDAAQLFLETLENSIAEYGN